MVFSFVLSGKHSYLEQSSEFYKGYFEGLSSENARGVDTLGLPYGFTDIYGKLTFNGDNGNKVSLFGFNFRDNVNYSNVSNLNWNASGGGANFVLVPATSKTLIEGVIAYSSYDIELKEADGVPRTSEITGFNSRYGFYHFLG